MDSVSLLSVICLLYQIQGSSAEEPKFVLKGKGILLDIQEQVVLENVRELTWKFNQSIYIVILHNNRDPEIYEDYTGRVEFPEQNSSMLLKRLTESDSGVYTAIVRTNKGEKKVAEHKIIVKAPVSPVVLTVDSVSPTVDSCNLTVTCSSTDSQIKARCDNQACQEETKKSSEVTTSATVLHVYLSNGSIICNHSNQVDSTTVMQETEPLCSPNDRLASDSTLDLKVAISTTTVFLILGILFAVCFYKRRKKYQKDQNQNTDYAAVPHLNPSPAEPADETTIYSMAGSPTAPKGTTQTTNYSVKDSVYAQVMK
ncbi:hypothetical protein LDENG_00030770 [Lucifuga dentata]|nr:hypothetical protein LDENG_00030770 [Lucifuga dentata]